LFGGPLRTQMDAFLALWPSPYPDPVTDGTGLWRGRLRVAYNEPYTFSVPAGGVVITIEGAVVLDSSASPPKITPTPLVVGQLYELEVQYPQQQAGMPVDVQWTSPSTPTETIPSTNLLLRSTLDAFQAS